MFICVFIIYLFFLFSSNLHLLLFLLWQVEISEDEAEDRLQDAIQEKFAVFGDVCLLYMHVHVNIHRY